MLAAIPPPPITSLHLGPLRVTLFGLVVAIAVLVGVSVTRRRYERAGGDTELVDRVLFPAILVGFVGARLAYVVTNTGRFQGRWLEVFAVWQGGLALFGGLTFGTLTAVWLVRRFHGGLGAFAAAAVSVLYGHGDRPSHSFVLVDADGAISDVRHYAEMFVPLDQLHTDLDLTGRT